MLKIQVNLLVAQDLEWMDTLLKGDIYIISAKGQDNSSPESYHQMRARNILQNMGNPTAGLIYILQALCQN